MSHETRKYALDRAIGTLNSGGLVSSTDEILKRAKEFEAYLDGRHEPAKVAEAAPVHPVVGRIIEHLAGTNLTKNDADIIARNAQARARG